MEILINGIIANVINSELKLEMVGMTFRIIKKAVDPEKPLFIKCAFASFNMFAFTVINMFISVS